MGPKPMASSGAARRRDAVSWLIVGPFLIPMRVAEIVTDLVRRHRAAERARRCCEWETAQAAIERAERRQRYYDGLGG